MDTFTSMLIRARKTASIKDLYVLEARLRDCCQHLNTKHSDDEDTIRLQGLPDEHKHLYMALRLDCLTDAEARDWLRRNG